MAPKAKTPMKAKPLSKGKNAKSLPKGTFAKKSILKKSKDKRDSLKKGAGSSTDKKPSKKNALNKKELSKLGKMSLSEKIEKAAETATSPEEAAKGLKSMMTKQDHSSAWSKHNIHMRGKSK